MSLNFQGITIFLTKRGVSKETWRSLISPLEMTNFHTKIELVSSSFRTNQLTCSTQRRWSFPSTCKFSFLLSFQSTGLLPGLQSSKLRPRANQTTAHRTQTRQRRTVRLRVHVVMKALKPHLSLDLCAWSFNCKRNEISHHAHSSES